MGQINFDKVRVPLIAFDKVRVYRILEGGI